MLVHCFVEWQRSGALFFDEAYVVEWRWAGTDFFGLGSDTGFILRAFDVLKSSLNKVNLSRA
jgi:2-keto-3-deoxy-L-rhamnonate aldolase RhmA